ncbi:MAG: PLP-dependent transferase [Lachnospiraceae bacterium]|nr:PLP-dependent transferase [Lachnospiraceae bacterium]
MYNKFETLCVHGDVHRQPDANRSISYPIYQTASFSHIKLGHNQSGFDYSRESNPTRSYLEETLASLEGAADALAFSSGMAAISVCFEAFKPGDHIICTDDLYGGAVRLFKLISEKNGYEIEYVDTRDEERIKEKIRPETRAIYVETPSNPMLHVTDIRRTAEIAHANNALLIVDNTFLSPYFQNPLALGADIVVHSGSKFLAGHNDTICGFLCTADEERAKNYRLLAKTTGAALAPFDSWLVLRGIKTLALRQRKQEENAGRLACWLKEREEVEEVFYLGLPEHKGYELNKKQARGFGSMISFKVRSGEIALKLLENVRLITFAESLGGVESLLTYPKVQTHPDVPENVRQKLGIDEKLLRLSVGIEDAEDLINDLRQAFEK